MTGEIVHTHRQGGKIKPSDKGPLITFHWQDCVDIGPMDVGHSTRVEFYIDASNGHERAIDVRRAK